MTRCDWCKRNFNEYKECVWESSIYSPNEEHLLCERCGEAEDVLIEQKGTNDIPEQLAMRLLNK